MTFVEGDNPPRAETMGNNHDADVGKPDVEIGVPPLEIDDRAVILLVEARDREAPRGQIVKKGAPRIGPDTASEQVVDFGRHRGRNHEFARFVAQEPFNV